MYDISVRCLLIFYMFFYIHCVPPPFCVSYNIYGFCMSASLYFKTTIPKRWSFYCKGVHRCGPFYHWLESDCVSLPVCSLLSHLCFDEGLKPKTHQIQHGCKCVEIFFITSFWTHCCFQHLTRELVGWSSGHYHCWNVRYGWNGWNGI